MCFTQFDMPHNLESLHLTARIAKRGFAAQLTGFREVESFSMTKNSHSLEMSRYKP